MNARALAPLLAVGLVVLAGCGGTAVPAADGPAATAASDGPTAVDGPATPDARTATAGTLSVYYLNVGQAASTLVVGPTGQTVLIDTGNFADDGEHVLAALDRYGVERIDHLVVSHADADHVGGAAAVVDHYETEADGIGAIYDPGIAAGTQTYERYLDAIEEHDVTLYETRAGDAVPVERVEASVLGPPEPYLDGRDRNENSIVLRLAFGGTSFLFTGDAEHDAEAHLLERYGDRVNATVLLAGHHGSNTSTGAAFLDAVDPRAAVVSSAYDSPYGHPHDETLSRLADRSIPTYWTATHGDVVVRSDGRNLVVETQRAAPTGPRELREVDRRETSERASGGTASREADPVPPGTSDPVTFRHVLCVGAGDGTIKTNAATVTGTTTADVTTAGTTTATDGGTAATTAATTATDGEATTATDDAPLVVDEIHADAAGDDRENLNGEYVAFRNAGADPLDLSRWTVADEAGHEYVVPSGVVLEPGATVVLYTGSGTDTGSSTDAGADTETELYWGQGSPVWNNDGDTVIVRNADGDRVLTEAYS